MLLKRDVLTAIGLIFCMSPFAHGAVLYVDNTLGGDCSGNYSIANRDCSGSDGSAYNIIQKAADATAPGDVVNIRGGDYHDVTSNCVGSGYCYIVYINNSGTDGNPITFQNYSDEKVSLIGFGFEDRDLNGDGDADGPSDVNGTAVERENLVVIDANYVHVKGLEISNSANTGLSIRGSYNRVENISMQDIWLSGIVIGYDVPSTKAVEYNVITGNEVRNARHGSGILMGRNFPSSTESYLNFNRYNTIEYNLSYGNGYLPDGTKVLPSVGDSVGGGNSDGVGVSKICSDSATETVPNWCPNNTLQNNVAYHNADDGFDMSFGDSVIKDNISFDNGPEGNMGYKVLRYVPSLSFLGNVGMTNDAYGFDLRVESGSPFFIYNNTSIRNASVGIYIYSDSSYAYNNLSAFNGSSDLRTGGCPDCSNNWLEDSNGDPKLVDAQFTVNTTLPEGASVSARRDFIRDQFVVALTPQADSPLVDAGRLIPGYHCEAAGTYPNDTCREWYGEAPDIGGYESGAELATIGDPFASLIASPTSLEAGQTATLTWTSGEVTSCQGTEFDTGGATSGSTNVSPVTDTTYTLTCSGESGTVTDTATVTVTILAPPTPPSALQVE